MHKVVKKINILQYFKLFPKYSIYADVVGNMSESMRYNVIGR